MADIVSEKVRSRMMSGIRGTNTKPELMVRRELFARGYRYRIHYKKLPGKPDIVFPKYSAVILVHGCFWHKHNCHLFKWPSTRAEFWRDKINRNIERDRKNEQKILDQGWRILIIWECALKGKTKRNVNDIAEISERFLKGNESCREISGIQ